jgi:Asp/Glu/hydantoin racemase
VSRKLVLLHTVAALIETFDQLAREILPDDVEVVHVADELLLKTVLSRGGLGPTVYRAVAAHAVAAEAAGANALMLTCSSISPCADVARHLVAIPVLKIDEPMVDSAIGLGSCIGVAATVPTTLTPTTELVRERARAANRQVTVDPLLCVGAYDALSCGDLQTHDRIVREGLGALMSRNDVVLLAQASMARVLDTIPAAERVIPVLSSPRLAMERARDVLG